MRLPLVGFYPRRNSIVSYHLRHLAEIVIPQYTQRIQVCRNSSTASDAPNPSRQSNVQIQTQRHSAGADPL